MLRQSSYAEYGIGCFGDRVWPAAASLRQHSTSSRPVDGTQARGIGRLLRPALTPAPAPAHPLAAQSMRYDYIEVISVRESLTVRTSGKETSVKPTKMASELLEGTRDAEHTQGQRAQRPTLIGGTY